MALRAECRVNLRALVTACDQVCSRCGGNETGREHYRWQRETSIAPWTYFGVSTSLVRLCSRSRLERYRLLGGLASVGGQPLLYAMECEVVGLYFCHSGLQKEAGREHKITLVHVPFQKRTERLVPTEHESTTSDLTERLTRPPDP